MTKNSPSPAWFQKYFEYRCDDCGSDTSFLSRARTAPERYLLPIMLLKPVRCAECFRRDYRMMFVPVTERQAEPARKVATSVPRAERHVA